MLTVLGGVLNMGNIAFEMDENEGAIVKEAHRALRTAAVSLKSSMHFRLFGSSTAEVLSCLIRSI